MKALLLVVVLVVVAASLSEADKVSLEERGFRQHVDVSDIHIDLSPEHRNLVRREMVELMSFMNVPFEMIEVPETKEAQDPGSGYKDMSSLIARFTTLEKALKAQDETEISNLSARRTVCDNNNKSILSNIDEINNSQAKIVSTIDEADAAIAVSLNTITNSENAENSLEDLLSVAQSERTEADVAFSVRRNKRIKEIIVLRKAIDLVCTFETEKNLDSCKKWAVMNAADKDELNIGDHHKEATKETTNPAELEQKWKKEKEDAKQYAEKNATKTTAPEPDLLIAMDKWEKLALEPLSAVQENQRKLINEIEELLSNNDMHLHVFQPIRRVTSLIRVGNTEDAASLATLLIDLMSRIKGEQRSETQDWLNNRKETNSRIHSLRTAMREERKRQAEAVTSIGIRKQHIVVNNSRYKSNVESLKYLHDKYDADRRSCNDFEADWFKKKSNRENEWANIEKLRSLIKTLSLEKVPQCKDNCNDLDHGRCIWNSIAVEDRKAVCSCKDAYYGDTCSFAKCPGLGGVLYELQHSDVCSRGNGSCDNTKGVCTCKDNYYSGPLKACELTKCKTANGKVCAGNGTCNASTGLCVCNDTYDGSVCQHRKCPDMKGNLVSSADASVCSGKGACDTETGVCRCPSDRFGLGCQFTHCPNKCMQRGTCDTSSGVCTCNSGYTGSSCEYLTCPRDCNSLKAGGKCDRKNGVCYCNNGFSGAACDPVTSCDSKHVDWSSSFKSQGWSVCPDGYLMIGLHRGASNALFGLEGAKCAQPCVNMTRQTVDSCASANWWASFDHKGWSTCPPDTYMQGLYRNSCNSLYCLEEVRCCRIKGSLYSSCTEANWWISFDSPGLSVVAANKFICGFYRSGDISNPNDNNLYNLEMAKECSFVEQSTLMA